MVFYQQPLRQFGPQKGVTPVMVETLENNLTHYAAEIKKLTGTDVTTLKGGGAAGGLAVAFVAFLNAQIKAGADYILDLISIDEAIKWSDLVIIGEGMIDSQTLMNKAPYAVAKRAKVFGKSVIAIAGSISLTKNYLFDGLFSIINKPMTLEAAIENVEPLTYQVSKELAGLILKMNKM